MPDDLQIIGFDDQPLMEVIGMSTVRQPMGEFGKLGGASPSPRCSRGRPLRWCAPPVAVASVELPLSLVLRETTRPASGIRPPASAGKRAGPRPGPG